MGQHVLRFVTGAGEHDSLDRRATLFFPPAVLPATLIFATVLAVAKSWGRIRGAGIQEPNGDEFRRGPSLYSKPDHPYSRRPSWES